METVDIKVVPLLFSFFLLIVPIYLSHVFKIGFIKPLLHSVIRMAVQLVLVGFFLKFLFRLNNPYVNIAWFAVMILVAVFSAVRGSSLKVGKVLIPAFISFTIVTLAIVLYLNGVIIRMKNIFDARYLIVLGGLLLGSSLRGNIIGISSFYKNIRKDSKRFLYILSLGATRHEATLPFLRESVQLAVKPILASMATMGIVALPGMMTGVIMGGASPEVAIKYQIMIMLAIVTSTISSIVLTILMTTHICFTGYGTLKSDIFI